MFGLTIPKTDAERGRFLAIALTVVAVILFLDRVITTAEVVRMSPTGKWGFVAYAGLGNDLVGGALLFAALLVSLYMAHTEDAAVIARSVIKLLGLLLIAMTIYFYAYANTNLFRSYSQNVGYGLVYTADPLIGAVFGLGAVWTLRKPRWLETETETDTDDTEPDDQADI